MEEATRGLYKYLSFNLLITIMFKGSHVSKLHEKPCCVKYYVTHHDTFRNRTLLNASCQHISKKNVKKWKGLEHHDLL